MMSHPEFRTLPPWMYSYKRYLIALIFFLRFRLGLIASVTDIKQLLLNISVHEDSRNVSRLLCFEYVGDLNLHVS